MRAGEECPDAIHRRVLVVELAPVAPGRASPEADLHPPLTSVFVQQDGRAGFRYTPVFTPFHAAY